MQNLGSDRCDSHPVHFHAEMAGLCLLFTSGVTSGLKCEISGTMYREFSQNYSARAARAHQEFGSDRCDSHPVHIHAKFARPSSHRVHIHAKSARKSSHLKSHLSLNHIRKAAHIHAKSSIHFHFQEPTLLYNNNKPSNCAGAPRLGSRQLVTVLPRGGCRRQRQGGRQPRCCWFCWCSCSCLWRPWQWPSTLAGTTG